jgi:hypothetical protein
MLRTGFESMKSLMEPTPRGFGTRGIREIARGHRSGHGMLGATRRYRDLKYRAACGEGIAVAAIPQRVFDEFYRGSEDAAVVRYRSARRWSSAGHCAERRI